MDRLLKHHLSLVQSVKMGKKIVFFHALFQRSLAFVGTGVFSQLEPVSRFASCTQMFKMYRYFCGHSPGAGRLRKDDTQWGFALLRQSFSREK